MGKSKGGRPKGPRPPLKSLVNFKGTEDYALWLDGFAEVLGISKAELLGLGLVELARSSSHEPPPDRMGGV